MIPSGSGRCPENRFRPGSRIVHLPGKTGNRITVSVLGRIPVIFVCRSFSAALRRGRCLPLQIYRKRSTRIWSIPYRFPVTIWRARIRRSSSVSWKQILKKTPGYGSDCYCEAAKAKIREACKAPAAEIFFLVGGTQTNATVIDAMLKSYQGVIAASTGHISVHEAGAIEFGGHKVLTLPHHNGKISASQIRALWEQYQNDANHDHMVMPGMVYLSHPTEYGTLYSREELIEIRSSVSSRTPRWSGWQSRWNSASGKRMMIPIRSSALPQAGQSGRRARRHCRTSERSK